MRLSVVVLAVVVGVALAAPFAKDKTRVWKPKAIRDKEAAEATVTPAVTHDADTAPAETRVVLSSGPTVIEERDESVASVKSDDEPVPEPAAEVKAVPPKPRIEWLVAEETPLVVDAETPKEEAIHDYVETALEAKSDSEVAYTAPVTTVEEVKAAPIITHEPVVEHVDEAKAAPEETISVVHEEPTVEETVAVVAPVVSTEEKNEYGATALAEKTETVATYPTAAEEVVKLELSAEVTPVAPAVVSIATVDNHPVAEEPKAVDPVVEEAIAATPVPDLIIEEPKIVEVEPEIVPIEAAPAIIVLDEPAAIEPVAEAVVPSKKTETISY